MLFQTPDGRNGCRNSNRKPAHVANVPPDGSRGQEKSPTVTDRAEKFWERMPERQFLYALPTKFVQMRNKQP